MAGNASINKGAGALNKHEKATGYRVAKTLFE
jgi:hypothetical protein